MTGTTEQSQTERTFDYETSTRHRVLAVERRRATCDALAQYGEGPVALDTLADAVANREADVDERDDHAVKRVAVTLHHLHLPLLADAGVLEYDANANLVSHDTEALARYTN